MHEPKHKINDRVWIADVSNIEEWITCPDCVGNKTLKVILGNGEELLIPCRCCFSQCHNSCLGIIRVRDKCEAKPLRVRIVGIEITESRIEYLLCFETGHTKNFSEEKIYLKEDEAMAASADIIYQQKREEKKRLQLKEKPAKDWAWHVHYHREQIRDAQEIIRIASERLGIALTKTKENKGASK